MTDYSSFEIEKIANTFVAFAEQECKVTSPLYYNLALQISKDKDLLKIASKVKFRQPIPNSLLAAVHFLLLQKPSESLADYYPTIKKEAQSEIPIQLFKAFVFENEAVIIKIIQNKIVQTNVINRCAYLMPILSDIISTENKPITIIDIGTSAGLTLNWDKYEYHYNQTLTVGKSAVKINCEIRNSELPAITAFQHSITKIGIDQHLINPADEREKLWLKALVWADQVERFIQIDEALKTDDIKNITFIEASEVNDFEDIIKAVDKHSNLIIYTLHTLYQFSPQARHVFYKMLDRIGMERDFYYLCAEGFKEIRDKYNVSETVIELTTYKNNHKEEKLIAETNGHGNWIEWM